MAEGIRAEGQGTGTRALHTEAGPALPHLLAPAAQGNGRDSPHSMKSSTQARVATITSKVSPMLCHMAPAAFPSPPAAADGGPLLEDASPPLGRAGPSPTGDRQGPLSPAGRGARRGRGPADASASHPAARPPHAAGAEVRAKGRRRLRGGGRASHRCPLTPGEGRGQLRGPARRAREAGRTRGEPAAAPTPPLNRAAAERRGRAFKRVAVTQGAAAAHAGSCSSPPAGAGGRLSPPHTGDNKSRRAPRRPLAAPNGAWGSRCPSR